MQDNSAISVAKTGNVLIDGMLGSTKWSQLSLTYSFPTSFAQYGTSYPAQYGVNFQPLSSAFQANALSVLREISAVTQLNFSLGTPETGTLRFGRFDDPQNLAYGFLPFSGDPGGDTWYANNSNAPGVSGDAQMHVFRHEIGHALGLKHPHEGAVTIPTDYDINAYTVMSYNNSPGGSVAGVFSKTFTSWEQSLMLLDIQALQSMYGANFTTNSGDTIYTFSPTTGEMLINGLIQGPVASNVVFRAIWDGGGTDTYNFSNYHENQRVDLNPGKWTTFSAGQRAVQSYTLSGNIRNNTYEPGNLINPFLYNGDVRSLIENVLTGDGADIIVGNVANNRANTGGGNDTITGGPGDDWIDGGSGTDTAVFSADRTLGSVTTTRNADGSITITTAADGADTLINVERFQFANTTYTTQRFVQTGGPLIANFNAASGWTSQDRTPRHIADLNGDGYADIVGFGQAGVLVSYGSAAGTFSGVSIAVANFGQAAGWSSDNLFHRELADVNGDGRADIVGFGQAGTLVSLARADGTFGEPMLGTANFGTAQGWTSQDGFARMVGDVNGDGKADIVGFGQAGTLVAMGNGDGTFQTVRLAVSNFGVAQGWTSDATFHRTLGDLNGDGRADLIGFGQAGTLVAFANADGSFGAVTQGAADFGVAQGWSSNDSFPRFAADLNGDGRADLVGFGQAGTLIAYGSGNGTFSATINDLANFGQAQGWTSDNAFHREIFDLNRDGYQDIVGFGQAGVLAALNNGTLVI